MKPRLLALLITGALLPVACSSGTASGDANAVVAALCQHLDRCAGDQGRMFASVADCTRMYGIVWHTECEPVAFANDPSMLSACVEEIKQGQCDYLSLYNFVSGRFRYFLGLFEACRLLRVPGQDYVLVGPGEACANNSNCPPGGYRCFTEEGRQPPVEGCGVCEIRTVGDECLAYWDCEDAAYCDQDADVCLARKENGRACADRVECLSYVCHSIDGVCTDPRASGSDCTRSDECRSDWCAGDTCIDRLDRGEPCSERDYPKGALACIQGVISDKSGQGQPCQRGWTDCLEGHACIQGSCTKLTPCSVGQTGDPCIIAVHCGPGTFCDVYAETCAPLLQIDEECSFDGQCQTDFCDYSAGRICKPRAQPGGACTSSDACPADHFCYNAICEPLLADGEPCSSDSDCQSDYCPRDTRLCREREECLIPGNP